MTLPVSGIISMSQVNTELGVASNTIISLNQANVRSLFGVASGTISMSNGHGKSQNVVVINLTVSSHVAYYNIRTAAINAGWNGSSPVQINLTINSGIYVYSDSISTPAIQTGTPYPAGSVIKITNNGYMIGKGGKGQHAGVDGPDVGGPALYLNYPVTITNNGYIAGGGGGGGCGLMVNPGDPARFGGGGGGAGGGDGGGCWNTSYGAANWGGAGGGLGAVGGNGVTDVNDENFGMSYGGGGGGRILPGVGGTGLVYADFITNGNAPGGGAGGSAGSAAAYIYGTTVNYGPCGGGGGWGAAGGAGDSACVDRGGVIIKGGSANNVGQSAGNSGFPGAAGGKAIVTKGHAVTWITTGNVYGIVG